MTVSKDDLAGLNPANAAIVTGLQARMEKRVSEAVSQLTHAYMQISLGPNRASMDAYFESQIPRSVLARLLKLKV